MRSVPKRALPIWLTIWRRATEQQRASTIEWRSNNSCRVFINGASLNDLSSLALHEARNSYAIHQTLERLPHPRSSMEPYLEAFLGKPFWRFVVKVIGPNLTLDILCFLGF